MEEPYPRGCQIVAKLKIYRKATRLVQYKTIQMVLIHLSLIYDIIPKMTNFVAVTMVDASVLSVHESSIQFFHGKDPSVCHVPSAIYCVLLRERPRPHH